jgi:2',3'-cyclic-nucleotide 2'-phosphodiesterase (5'-nucleotidase family)
MKTLKKWALPLAFLLAVGIFAVFSFPACDNNPNPPQHQGKPWDPIEPETPWVDGPVTVDIYSFNDFHGTMDNSASSSDPGAARFTAIVKHLMSQGSEHSMLLAAGDNYQGSALSNYFEGEPVSKMMKELGVKYSAVGNHEWDWGSDMIDKFAEDGGVAFLAADIFLQGTENQPDFCHPYVIANRAGRKIGIVGLTVTETPSLVSASAIEGYEFRSPSAWLKNMVADLKTVQNCDAVIALTHKSSATTLTANSNEIGFDAIITAHSHQTVNTTSNGVPVVQAANNGRALAKLSFSFNNDGLVGVTANIYSGFTSSSILPTGTVDATVAAMVAEYDAQIAPIMNEVIGVFGNASSVGKNAWANQLVFDYIVRKASEPGWKAGPGWNDFILIQNAGGWRSVAIGGPNDDVTVKFMWTLMPFDNEIYLFELKGSDLISLLGRSLGSSAVLTNLTRSGSTYTVSSTGEQISNSDKLYKVSMNDFMFTGGDNFGVDSVAVYDPATLILGVPLRDGMIEQLKWRRDNGETPPPPSQTVGTLTGGPLVHAYEITAANTRYVEDTALIHLINDAMLYYTQSYGTTLSGTAPLSPTANAEAGTLTANSMSGIYIYDNTLCVAEMTGNQFKEWMEWAYWDYHQTKMKPGDLTVPYGGAGQGYNFDQFKGLSYKVDLTQDKGSRIVEMKNLDGTPFNLTGTYKAAVNNFRLNALIDGTICTGSVTVTANNVASGAPMQSILADYIKDVKGGAITNEFIPSWEFIMPDEDEDWYPAYRAKAVELLNNGTLTFSAVRPVTVHQLRTYMPENSGPPVGPPYDEEDGPPPLTGTFKVDFEDSKWDGTAYADRTVLWGGYEWSVSGVVNPDGNDRYSDTKSVRLRGNTGDNCRVEMIDYLPGLKSISFDYASYGSHSGGTIVLYSQTQGGIWTKVNEVVAPAWGGSMETASYTTNINQRVRFRIVREGGLGSSSSVNIDNIVIVTE